MDSLVLVFFYHYHNSNIIIMKSFKCDHLIKRHLQDEVENLSLVVGLAAWVHNSWSWYLLMHVNISTTTIVDISTLVALVNTNYAPTI